MASGLKLSYGLPLSNFAFNFYSRHYMWEGWKAVTLHGQRMPW